MNEWQQQNQVAFMQGFSFGVKIGYEKGLLDGIENTISYIGNEASKKLREEHKGELMAFYRELKSNMRI